MGLDMHRRGLLAAGLVSALCLVAASPTEPRLEGFDVVVGEHELLLDFQLRDAFSADVHARIASGLPTTFSYDFVLLRDRKRWWDDKLRETNLEVVAMYNAVSQEFLVNFKLDGELVDSRMVRNRPELERAMTRFDDLAAFALAGLPTGERLLVKARAEVGSRTILGFIPTRVTTPWAESRKFRLSGTNRS